MFSDKELMSSTEIWAINWEYQGMEFEVTVEEIYQEASGTTHVDVTYVEDPDGNDRTDELADTCLEEYIKWNKE